MKFLSLFIKDFFISILFLSHLLSTSILLYNSILSSNKTIYSAAQCCVVKDAAQIASLINTTQPETRKLQQVCYHQANIRMRSHRLLRLHDNRLAASCELLQLHAGLMQVVSSTCSKSANNKLQQV